MSGRVTSKKKSKNASYFSHEFIISNHGDIVSVAAMFFVLGLMYQGTRSVASNFVFIHHNLTDDDPATADGARNSLYVPGKLDFCVMFFYFLICIVSHAVLQEYIIDKITKKLNLSRLRVGKFSESGQLACFYVISTFWIVYVLIHETYITSLTGLWEGYPHNAMPFWIKLFYVFQICYWFHLYTELYFQRVRKDEIPSRLFYITLYLIGSGCAYAGGLTKLGLIMLLLHYSTDIFLHASKMFHMAGYTNVSYVGFSIWNVLFIPVRMACTILSFLTFQYGLAKYTVPSVSISEGNYNTRVLRINAMLFICLTQAYMVWNFITFHQSRRRKQQSQLKLSKAVYATNQDLMAQKRKEKKKVKREEEESSDVAESDQSNQKDVRSRKNIKLRT